jgi:hypothetical protein
VGQRLSWRCCVMCERAVWNIPQHGALKEGVFPWARRVSSCRWCAAYKPFFSFLSCKEVGRKGTKDLSSFFFIVQRPCLQTELSKLCKCWAFPLCLLSTPFQVQVWMFYFDSMCALVIDIPGGQEVFWDQQGIAEGEICWSSFLSRAWEWPVFR